MSSVFRYLVVIFCLTFICFGAFLARGENLACDALLRSTPAVAEILEVIEASQLKKNDLIILQRGINPFLNRRDQNALIFSPLIDEILKTEDLAGLSNNISKILMGVNSQEKQIHKAKKSTQKPELKWIKIPGNELWFSYSSISSNRLKVVNLNNYEISLGLLPVELGFRYMSIYNSQKVRKYEYRIANIHEIFALINLMKDTKQENVYRIKIDERDQTLRIRQFIDFDPDLFSAQANKIYYHDTKIPVGESLQLNLLVTDEGGKPNDLQVREYFPTIHSLAGIQNSTKYMLIVRKPR